MDDVILIIFVAFCLVLFFIGFFKKQILLTIFSGIGFILIGVFILQGVTYISGSNITDVNTSFTTVHYITSTWNSQYKVPLFSFLALFGSAMILISGAELFHFGKEGTLEKIKGNNNNDDEDDESE